MFVLQFTVVTRYFRVSGEKSFEFTGSFGAFFVVSCSLSGI